MTIDNIAIPGVSTEIATPTVTFLYMFAEVSILSLTKTAIIPLLLY